MKQTYIEKPGKLAFIIFSFACITAILACSIVDFAINRRITWALYPILSVPFGWFVLSPAVVKKIGTPLALCSLMVFVLPYLYLMDKITPVQGWFTPIGIPSVIVGVPLIWLIYLLFRFIKINFWFKASITVFLAGVVANPIINHFINVYTQEEPSFFLRFINIFPCFVAAVLLLILGIGKKREAAA